MKKPILVCWIVASFTCALAQQQNDTVKRYHNEFGTDVTALFKQLVIFNSNTSQNTFGQQAATNVEPLYYLTYRRHFKGSNIRFGIGGNISQQDVNLSGEEHVMDSKQLSLRIGYEFYKNIGKRSQVFYGLDFKPLFYSAFQTYHYTDYLTQIETSKPSYGVSPLLGYRFKFNERLSLSTEASFGLFFQQEIEKKSYLPKSEGVPGLEDQIEKTDRLFTSFSQPISILFTFDI